MNRASRIVTSLWVASPFVLGGCAGTRSLPGQSGQNLLSVLASNPDLSLFAQLIADAGLEHLLDGSDPMTLLAPNNRAVEALCTDLLGQLRNPTAADMLAEVLRNHMIPGKFTASEIAGGTGLTNLLGHTLPVSGSAGALKIGEANLVESNLEGSNGFIQKIDRVLLP